jgi:ribosomal small subunit protein bTHX
LLRIALFTFTPQLDSFDLQEVFVGKGDLRTKRGKIYRGSYGKARPKRKKGKGRETKPE